MLLWLFCACVLVSIINYIVPHTNPGIEWSFSDALKSANVHSSSSSAWHNIYLTTLEYHFLYIVVHDFYIIHLLINHEISSDTWLAFRCRSTGRRRLSKKYKNFNYFCKDFAILMNNNVQRPYGWNLCLLNNYDNNPQYAKHLGKKNIHWKCRQYNSILSKLFQK